MVVATVGRSKSWRDGRAISQTGQYHYDHIPWEVAADDTYTVLTNIAPFVCIVRSLVSIEMSQQHSCYFLLLVFFFVLER